MELTLHLLYLKLYWTCTHTQPLMPSFHLCLNLCQPCGEMIVCKFNASYLNKCLRVFQISTRLLPTSWRAVSTRQSKSGSAAETASISYPILLPPIPNSKNRPKASPVPPLSCAIALFLLSWPNHPNPLPLALQTIVDHGALPSPCPLPSSPTSVQPY